MSEKCYSCGKNTKIMLICMNCKNSVFCKDCAVNHKPPKCNLMRYNEYYGMLLIEKEDIIRPHKWNLQICKKTIETLNTMIIKLEEIQIPENRLEIEKIIDMIKNRLSELESYNQKIFRISEYIGKLKNYANSENFYASEDFLARLKENWDLPKIPSFVIDTENQVTESKLEKYKEIKKIQPNMHIPPNLNEIAKNLDNEISGGLNKIVSELEKKVINVYEKVENTQNTYEMEKKKLAEFKKKSEEEKKQNEHLSENEKSEKLKEIANLENRKKTVQEEIKKMENNDIPMVKKQLNIIRDENSKNYKINEELKLVKDKYNETIKLFEIEKNKTKAENDKLNETKLKITYQHSEHSNLMKTINEKKKKNENLDKEIKSKKETINNLDGSIKDYNISIKSYEAKIDELKKQKASLKAENSEFKQQNIQLESALTYYENLNDVNQELLNEISKQRKYLETTLKSEIDAENIRYYDVVRLKENMQEECERLNKKINEQHKELEKTNEQIKINAQSLFKLAESNQISEENKAEQHDLRRKISELNGKISELEQKNKQVVKHIQKMRSAMGDIKKEMKEIRSNVSIKILFNEYKANFQNLMRQFSERLIKDAEKNKEPKIEKSLNDSSNIKADIIDRQHKSVYVQSEESEKLRNNVTLQCKNIIFAITNDEKSLNSMKTIDEILAELSNKVNDLISEKESYKAQYQQEIEEMKKNAQPQGDFEIIGGAELASFKNNKDDLENIIPEPDPDIQSVHYKRPLTTVIKGKHVINKEELKFGPICKNPMTDPIQLHCGHTISKHALHADIMNNLIINKSGHINALCLTCHEEMTSKEVKTIITDDELRTKALQICCKCSATLNSSEKGNSKNKACDYYHMICSNCRDNALECKICQAYEFTPLTRYCFLCKAPKNLTLTVGLACGHGYCVGHKPFKNKEGKIYCEKCDKFQYLSNTCSCSSFTFDKNYEVSVTYFTSPHHNLRLFGFQCLNQGCNKIIPHASLASKHYNIGDKIREILAKHKDKFDDYYVMNIYKP